MLLELSILELAKQIRDKKISPEDIINECYDNIEKQEKNIHAFITLRDKKDVLARIKKSDSSLYGIPYVMKDAYATKGIRTTAASHVLENFIPSYSATVYTKLEDAGAVLLGKMNMDAWGHGGSTENTDFPVTKNPWDSTRSAGGSGGGPAAAVASRFCMFGIGEDTGGSIRNPAAWNNISAMKVTYGRVSRYGAIAYASSLDTVGPTAKTVEDCAVVLETIAGHDPFDATSSDRKSETYSAFFKKDFRIAVPQEFFGAGLDAEIEQAIKKAVDTYRTLGIQVEEIAMPMLEFGVPLYYILAPSETSSNLGRYDGIRFGRGREKFTQETMRRIMTGTYTLSSGYYDAFYKKAQKARTLFIKKYAEVFEKFDAILSPINPIMPPKFGELLDDPVKNMMADLYTVPINIGGMPSLALPCGFSPSGLPIGMQLIGDMFAERTLFSIGHMYQEVTNWQKRRPL